MRELSVSRAAQRMGMAQSSMSELLGRLRDRFSDPLFVRTRHGIVATERAQRLQPKVRATIELLRELAEPTGGFDPARAAVHFRVTATDYAQMLFMSSLTQLLIANAPHCTLELVTVNLRTLEAALETGDVDLAIAYHPDPPPSLRRSPLFTDRYVCIARKGHPALDQALTAELFAVLSHMNVSPSGLSYFANAVDSALETQDLARKVVVTCPHFLLASHLVSQTDLVLAMPHRAALALMKFFPIQLIEIPLSMAGVDVAMYWHERCHHSASHRWLRKQVRSLLTDPVVPC
jgi:DNA-binding transcriptional LysR family regulator